MEELEKAFALVAGHLAEKSDGVKASSSTAIQPRSLWHKMNEDRQAREIQKNQSDPLPGFGAGKSKASLVREAFTACAGNFTASDIYGDLAAKGVVDLSKNDVSFVLSRMCKAGKIVLVKQGAGKTPSTYRNPQTESLPSDVFDDL